MTFNDSALNTTGSVWARCYTSDGFQVSLTLPAQTADEAAAQIDAIRAAGFLPMMPEQTAGELIETMVMCVRRETVNKHDETVPVIDCYFNGGKFKWVTLYLDDDAQRADFERQSGLVVGKMPLYASQAPLQAGERATMKYEVICPRPFVAVKVPAREKEVNGVKQMTYKFARYGGQPALTMLQQESTQAPVPAPTAPKAAPVPVNEHAFDSRKPDTRKPVSDNAPAATKSIDVDAAVWIKIGKDGNPFYVFYAPQDDHDVFSFTREPFRAAGWDVDAWEYDALLDEGIGTQINLDRYPKVVMEQAKDGYWHVKHVSAYEFAEPYEEGQTA